MLDMVCSSTVLSTAQGNVQATRKPSQVAWYGVNMRWYTFAHNTVRCVRQATLCHIGNIRHSGSYQVC